MNRRQAELSDLQSYLIRMDKDVTMVLQSLQWDRNHLLQDEHYVTCSISSHHKIPLSKRDAHERACVRAGHGCTDNKQMLPDPPQDNALTLVKFSKEDIQNIIANASRPDPQFRKGVGHTGTVEPLSLQSIQCTYTPDERRAIHDAVVAAAPTYTSLTDLPLTSSEGEGRRSPVKSTLEVLSERRDMRRRRVKYRLNNKSRNYSDVLRHLIDSQMELYTEVQNETKEKSNHSVHSGTSDRGEDKYRGHATDGRDSETTRHSVSEHDNAERSRENVTTERYKKECRSRENRGYEKDYNSSRRSSDSTKRKSDGHKERAKQDFQNDIRSSSRHYNREDKYEHTHYKAHVKIEREGESRRHHDTSQEVRIKRERESTSPGSCKDWKSYKEHAHASRSRGDGRSAAPYQHRSRESKLNHNRHDDVDDADEVRKRRHKKISSEKYRE